MSLSSTGPAPTVGRMVHYVSYGTPGGEYGSECRAAVITAVRGGSGVVDLAVLNPTGLFFDCGASHSEDEKRGGTWHWPERA